MTTLHHHPGDSTEQRIRKESLQKQDIVYASSYMLRLRKRYFKSPMHALDVNMSAEDVKTSYRIKSNETCTVLVKFQSHKGEWIISEARTKLKNLNTLGYLAYSWMCQRAHD